MLGFAGLDIVMQLCKAAAELQVKLLVGVQDWSKVRSQTGDHR